MTIIAVFQALVPLFLIVMTALVRKPTKTQWFLNSLAFGLVIAFLWATARWDLSSLYLRPVYPVLFVVAAIVGFKRIRIPEKSPKKSGVVASTVTSVALIIMMTGLNVVSYRGYKTPESPIELQSPLRDGRFVVLNGGASTLLNGHFKLRAQSYALDILGLNKAGQSAGLFSDRTQLSNYAIFGATVFSPCEGVVAASIDLFSELTPPNTDPDNPAGNHVVLECQGVEVILAHLKQGSVLVQVGDTVNVQSIIGQVGNTGNTSEPHLHIHTESLGETGVILDGKSVPLTINGRFLARGDVLSLTKR